MKYSKKFSKKEIFKSNIEDISICYAATIALTIFFFLKTEYQTVQIMKIIGILFAVSFFIQGTMMTTDIFFKKIRKDICSISNIKETKKGYKIFLKNSNNIEYNFETKIKPNYDEIFDVYITRFSKNVIKIEEHKTFSLEEYAQKY